MGSPDNRNLEPAVKQAVSYWDSNLTRHTDFTGRFRFVDSTADADIILQFVNDIDQCGYGDLNRIVGCAPQYSSVGAASSQTVIEIVDNYVAEDIRENIKHEIGHTVGLTHDSQLNFMTRAASLDQTPKTDAVNRSYPWNTDNFSIYINTTNSYDLTPAHHDQIGHVADYYSDGAEEHVPENVTMDTTDHGSNATIVVTMTDVEGSDSDQQIYGYSVDADRPLEYQSYMEIYVDSDVETELVGWYVGLWIAYSFNMVERNEMPPPFRESDYDTASSDWWN